MGRRTVDYKTYRLDMLRIMAPIYIMFTVFLSLTGFWTGGVEKALVVFGSCVLVVATTEVLTQFVESNRMEFEMSKEVTQEDVEKAKDRLTMAMGSLTENRISVERHLQHAHAALGGKKEELYGGFDDDE